MSLRLEKKQIIILSVSLLLAAAMYFGAYLLYLSPLKTSAELKASQLKTEQQLSETLAERMASNGEGTFNSTAELQKILPADPMIEQLVLDLEKAEVISGSLINSIEFSDASGMGMNSEDMLQQENPTGLDTGDSSVEMEMPAGLAKTVVAVSVESPDYFGLEKFIETIENLQRFVMIESIAFSGPEEIDTIPMSGENKPIMVTLVWNSFYLTGMDDLKDFNPKIETPEPANKRNPFPTFGDYSEDNLTEMEQPAEGETEGTDEN